MKSYFKTKKGSIVVFDKIVCTCLFAGDESTVVNFGGKEIIISQEESEAFLQSFTEYLDSKSTPQIRFDLPYVLDSHGEATRLALGDKVLTNNYEVGIVAKIRGNDVSVIIDNQLYDLDARVLTIVNSLNEDELKSLIISKSSVVS